MDENESVEMLHPSHPGEILRGWIDGYALTVERQQSDRACRLRTRIASRRAEPGFGSAGYQVGVRGVGRRRAVVIGIGSSSNPILV